MVTPLVTGNEDRRWLYVAITRGTHGNHIFTRPARIADLTPGTRPAPEPDRHRRFGLQRQGLPPNPPRSQETPQTRATPSPS